MRSAPVDEGYSLVNEPNMLDVIMTTEPFDVASWEPMMPSRAEMNELISLCVADEDGGGDNNLSNFITERASSNGHEFTAAARFAANQHQPGHISITSPVLEQGGRGLVTSQPNSRVGRTLSESGRWYVNGSRSRSATAAATNHLIVTPVGGVAGLQGSGVEDIRLVDEPPVHEAAIHSRVTARPPLLRRQATVVRITDCDSSEAADRSTPGENNNNISKTDSGDAAAASDSLVIRSPGGRNTHALLKVREANRLAVRKHRAQKKDALQAQKEECDRLMALLAQKNKELNQLRHGVPALNLEERKELEQLRAFRARIIEAVNIDSTVDRSSAGDDE